MKFIRLIGQQGLSAPVLALTLASVILTALVAYRIIAGAQVRHAYLVWNLILFSLFLLLGYVMLHAMTQARTRDESPIADSQ